MDDTQIAFDRQIFTRRKWLYRALAVEGESRIGQMDTAPHEVANLLDEQGKVKTGGDWFNGAGGGVTSRYAA